MENMLYGRERDPSLDKWETYDLKPIDYLYPERDLLPSPLVSEETISRLADEFPDKISLTRTDYEDMMGMLRADTELLEASNAVDYSLLLVRFPASSEVDVVGRRAPWRVGGRLRMGNGSIGRWCWTSFGPSTSCTHRP